MAGCLALPLALVALALVSWVMRAPWLGGLVFVVAIICCVLGTFDTVTKLPDRKRDEPPS